MSQSYRGTSPVEKVRGASISKKEEEEEEEEEIEEVDNMKYAEMLVLK